LFRGPNFTRTASREHYHSMLNKDNHLIRQLSLLPSETFYDPIKRPARIGV
jgi:hypothetical protein